MYHLKQLTNDGLVQKRDDGKYELTLEGQNFSDSLSLKTLNPRIQPKIVTLLVCQNNKGEFLLYKRGKQPFLGLIGFPYGKIHLGEKIAAAAERELLEKTGLKTKPVHRGDVYLTIFKNGQVFTQMFCHVFTSKNTKGELIQRSEIGQCFWEKINNPKDPKFMSGFAEVFSLVKKRNRGLFFTELTYNL